MSQMTKIATTLGVAAVSIAVVTASPANAAQGGFDSNGNPHAWIKVGYGEAVRPNNTGGHSFVYNGGCPGVADRNQCSKLSQGISREFLASPNRVVGGYWAEYYPKTGALRSGTW
ncbi:MAG: hypothetical protein QOH57_2554 [Mycobacterium sp.]|jgi:hypothetical protein|nr:hypothetical protein [Mycobacterium sp.]